MPWHIFQEDLLHNLPRHRDEAHCSILPWVFLSPFLENGRGTVNCSQKSYYKYSSCFQDEDMKIRYEIWSTDLFLLWMVSTAASMLTVTSLKEPVAADCKNTEYIAQLGLLNVKFMKNEDKICFLIHTVRLCHLSLHELHPFFHFYHNSHTSYLWQF